MNEHFKIIALISIFGILPEMFFAQLKTKFDFYICNTPVENGIKKIDTNQQIQQVSIFNLTSVSNDRYRNQSTSLSPEFSVIRKDYYAFAAQHTFCMRDINLFLKNKSQSSHLNRLNETTNLRVIKTFNSDIDNSSNAFALLQINGNDFIAINSNINSSQLKKNDHLIDGSYYFGNYGMKVPRFNNIDYALLDFNESYFARTEFYHSNYVTENDLYHTRRGYFMTAYDNSPRYLYTKGFYNYDNDPFIIQWLFFLVSDIKENRVSNK